MAFAQRRPVRSKDQRVVSEERGLPGQCLIEEDLPGCVGEMVFPSNDMSDFHQMVVNDTGKVIGGHPIGTDDNEIAHPGRIEVHLSMDEVFKKDRSSAHVESEDRLKAGRFHFGNLFGGEGATPSVIAGHPSFRKLFFSKFFKSFFGAETLITFPLLGQPVGIPTVDGDALRLTIWTHQSIAVRSLVPQDPQPSKIFHDPIHGGIVRSLQIRVFDTKNQCPLITSCKKKIEESSPGISDMEKPGGGRSKANPNLRCHF